MLAVALTQDRLFIRVTHVSLPLCRMNKAVVSQKTMLYRNLCGIWGAGGWNSADICLGDDSHRSKLITMITMNDAAAQQLSLQARPLCPNNNKLEWGAWQVTLLPLHCSFKAAACITLKKKKKKVHLYQLFLYGWSTPPSTSLQKQPGAPLVLIIRVFFPPWSMGGTWKCINLDSSLQ